MPYLAAHSVFSIGSLIGEIKKIKISDTKIIIVPGNVKIQNYLALLKEEKKKPLLKTTTKDLSN